MRRLFTLGLLVAFSFMPAWAQRGGGGHGGGGSMGGGHAAGGGAVARGGSGYTYRGSVGTSGYAHIPSYGGGYRGGSSWSGGYSRWNGNGWRGNYPYRGWGYPYRWGYPGWGWGYVGWGGYPYWGWYGGTGWYDYYPSDAYTTAQNYPTYVYVTPNDSGDSAQSYQTQDQIDRLTGEVEQLRSQQQSQIAAQGKTVDIHGETVLIYRDGHAEEVQNYAIVGKTIWVFNESRARKIPLADLDLPATRHSNEDRGIDFVVPVASR